MLAVDTNVLVRLLSTDNPTQTKKARDLFANNEVLVTSTVLLEAAWVLGHAFEFSQTQIVDAFRGLGGLPQVHLQDPDRVIMALDWAEQGLDIADAFHLSATPDIPFVTFDRKLAKRAGDVGGPPIRLL